MSNSAGFDIDLSMHDDQRSFKTVSTLTLDVSAHPVSSLLSLSQRKKQANEDSPTRKTQKHSRSKTPSSPRRRRGRSLEHPRKEFRQNVIDVCDGTEQHQRSRTRSPTRRTRNHGTKTESRSTTSSEKVHQKHPCHSESLKYSRQPKHSSSSPRAGGRRASMSGGGRSQSPSKHSRRGGENASRHKRRQSTSPTRRRRTVDKKIDASPSLRRRSLSVKPEHGKGTQHGKYTKGRSSGECVPSSPASRTTKITSASSYASDSSSYHSDGGRRRHSTSDEKLPPPPPFQMSPRLSQATKRSSSNKHPRSAGSTPIINGKKRTNIKDKVAGAIRSPSILRKRISTALKMSKPEAVVDSGDGESVNGSSCHSRMSNSSNRSATSRSSARYGATAEDSYSSIDNNTKKQNEVVMTKDIERRIVELVNKAMDERESQIVNHVDKSLECVNERVKRCEGAIIASVISKVIMNEARKSQDNIQRGERREGSIGIDVIEIE